MNFSKEREQERLERNLKYALAPSAPLRCATGLGGRSPSLVRFMATKAIVGVGGRTQLFTRLKAFARRLEAGEGLPAADYHLDFASAAQLFSELTPARLELIETLKATGPQSIYALAKRLDRHYGNVHRDVRKLVEHGLLARDEKGRVHVPWDQIEIHFSLGSAA